MRHPVELRECLFRPSRQFDSPSQTLSYQHTVLPRVRTVPKWQMCNSFFHVKSWRPPCTFCQQLAASSRGQRPSRFYFIYPGDIKSSILHISSRQIHHLNFKTFSFCCLHHAGLLGDLSTFASTTRNELPFCKFLLNYIPTYLDLETQIITTQGSSFVLYIRSAPALG